MKLRSLLFVPGDRPDRMEKALDAGADALILDLEDAVAPENKPKAREAVATFLKKALSPLGSASRYPGAEYPRHSADRAGGTIDPETERHWLGEGQSGARLFVRINPLDSPLADADLAAILSVDPDGIVLPKAEGATSLQLLDAMLGGSRTKILPIVTETPAALFRMDGYGGVTERLIGLTWGAEDLPAAIGATTSRNDDGSYTPPYQLARSLTLFAAAAAGVAPIETVYPAFRDLEGLATYAARGARDGFTGMMAIHPAQVPIINQAFTPGEEALAQARAIVAAFDANPGAGVLSLDGKMIDAPHLKQARRLLDRA